MGNGYIVNNGRYNGVVGGGYPTGGVRYNNNSNNINKGYANNRYPVASNGKRVVSTMTIIFIYSFICLSVHYCKVFFINS